MADAGLGHHEPEEVLHGVLVRFHRLPVLEVVEEDVVRVELDGRLANLRVHSDLVADVVEGEVPRTPEGDLAELATPTASPHHLVHRMHRRPEDFRDLVDRWRGRVREAHDRRSVVVHDSIEDLRDKMVDLPVHDVVDAEALLHLLAVVEVPRTGPAQDDFVLPVRPLDALDEVEEHRFRVWSEDAAHRERHADWPEAEWVHRVKSNHLRFVVDVLCHSPGVGDHDLVPAVCPCE